MFSDLPDVDIDIVAKVISNRLKTLHRKISKITRDEPPQIKDLKGKEKKLVIEYFAFEKIREQLEKYLIYKKAMIQYEKEKPITYKISDVKPKPKKTSEDKTVGRTAYKCQKHYGPTSAKEHRQNTVGKYENDTEHKRRKSRRGSAKNTRY